MATENDSRLFGLTRRALPSKVADSVYGNFRGSRYGELYTQPLAGAKMQALADEGSYFIATNATPLTGIAGIAAADGLDDLEALLFMRNGASTDGKRVYLDFIEIDVITAVGTNGTNFSVAMKTDSGASRYASGGTAIVAKNANQDDSTTTVLSQMFFGAVVPTAATSDARLVWHQRLRSVIKVLGDKYRFEFGSPATPPFAGMVMEGTAQVAVTCRCPPVVIGPGQSFFLHEFALSQTVAAQYQFAMGWWER